jgi:hypothetical protein
MQITQRYVADADAITLQRRSRNASNWFPGNGANVNLTVQQFVAIVRDSRSPCDLGSCATARPLRLAPARPRPAR